jgi:H+/Cl- antiporter ClcA
LFRWKNDQKYAKFLIKLGGKWFMYFTMVQFAIGIWFLISQPRDKMMLFMGDNLLATIAILIGIFGGLAAIFIMSDALRKDDPRSGFYLASGLVAVVILAMVIMRDILRGAYLGAYFNSTNFAVQTQWEVLPLFLVLFVAGVVLWFIMLKKYPFSMKQ